MELTRSRTININVPFHNKNKTKFLNYINKNNNHKLYIESWIISFV